MKNHARACELADVALEQALEKIDELEEDDFRDAKSIIELLKENLTLWKEEDGEEAGQDDWLWLTAFCVLVQAFLRPVSRLFYPYKFRRILLSIVSINTCSC